MKNENKVNIICNWLKQGYFVYEKGKTTVAMLKSFSTLIVYKNGKYMTKYSKREVGGFVNDVFGNADFYAIDENGNTLTTNEMEV